MRQAVSPCGFTPVSANRQAAQMSVVEITSGDILDQPVDAIVNAWNRNFIPWWLLLPHRFQTGI